MDIRYRIRGRKPLQGVVDISGSKNAALPLLAATACVNGMTVLRNVPRLSDTITMCNILEYLGAKVTFEGNTVTVDASTLVSKSIPHDLVSKLRGCIVLLGPLLARFGRVEMSYPGGCVLGKRPIGSNIDVFTQLGIQNDSTTDKLSLHGTFQQGRRTNAEFSVTGTESILLALALQKGSTTVDLCALEPHVQDVCHFLEARGVRIVMNGPHSLTVHGTGSLLLPGEYAVRGDYLEAGGFLIAGALTKGEVTVRGVERDDLISFLTAMSRMGVVLSVTDNAITVHGDRSSLKATKIQTNIFPGFPTDLQAPFGVLMTQADGVSRIFEVLFEGRLSYLYELENMGAKIEILNAHQALIIGPTLLRGRSVPSNDIRAGMGMVLAGLVAEGETIVTDVRYIERGYERMEEKLRSLGADIVREESSS